MDPAVIVSDLHIGSVFFLRHEFLTFLDELPPKTTLIFNGDVVDSRLRFFSPDEEHVMARIEAESHRRRVIWIAGNHDERFMNTPRGCIEFKPYHTMGTHLLITHGSEFDGIRRHAFVFFIVFRTLHYARMVFGAPHVHVAFYAKKWPRLYNVLRRHVAKRAVRHAGKNGYSAVVCGHIHCAEDAMIDGIRYINTGAWTERPAYYLRIDGADMELVKWHEGGDHG